MTSWLSHLRWHLVLSLLRRLSTWRYPHAERRHLQHGAQLLIDISCPQGISSKSAAANRWDIRTDARPLHRPCCAYCAGGVNTTASVERNRSSAYTRCSETLREVRLLLSVADERARQVTHWPITRRDACRKVTTQQIAVVLVQDNMSQTASCNNRQC